MKIGDLIEHEGRRWFVTGYHQEIKVGVLLDAAGTRKELADDAPDCRVVVNAPESWPTLAAPVKNRAGPFVKLAIPGVLGREDRVLEPWVSWVQSDPFREGGSIYVSPDVGLLPGVVLIATHRNGAVVRVQVPRTYGTVAQKQAAATRVPPEPINRFRHILDDDET
jgi:hypothetical protein